MFAARYMDLIVYMSVLVGTYLRAASAAAEAAFPRNTVLPATASCWLVCIVIANRLGTLPPCV